MNGDSAQWRNIRCEHEHDAEPDPEIDAAEALETALGNVSDEASRIRALISRIDSLTHYKALDNLSFILRAIGDMTYPGAPAVDVLWREYEIERERRERFIRYAKAAQAWADGAKDETQTAESKETYDALGEPAPEKTWLAVCLAKTLREMAYEPDDYIAEHSDEAYAEAAYRGTLRREPSDEERREAALKERDALLEQLLNSEERLQQIQRRIHMRIHMREEDAREDAEYVQAVYETVLGRAASQDDEQFRVQELRDWKTREQLLIEVVNSAENRANAKRRIVRALRRQSGGP